MKAKTLQLIKIFSFIFLIQGQLFADSVSVMPDNISNFGRPQLGNFMAPSCDGADPSFTRVIIKPSCYGGNLRSAGRALNPSSDITLNLSISNSGQSFSSKITFPAKVVWPKNYGSVCDWENRGAKSNSGLDLITCDIKGTPILYDCSYISASFFLSDQLKCVRKNDLVGDGALNQNILCTFMYNWRGTGFGATSSYTKIGGVASCGLEEKDPNYPITVTANSIAPASVTTSAARGLVIVDYKGLNIKKQSVIKNMATGKLVTSGPRSSISGSYVQGGVVTSKQQVAFDDYEQCLQMKVSFLGGNRFCGSYYSPIMIFFDKNRPKFIGRSSFPLYPDVKMVSWPEKKSSGYFLAMDKSHKKNIRSGKQLFGEDAKNGYANGFEKLRNFDKNNDFKIDKSDAIFKSLYLWNDKNGNGISEKSEVFTLKDKGVLSISIYYDEKTPIQFGTAAEARQFGTFEYQSKGKKKTGEAIDIWFAPNPR